MARDDRPWCGSDPPAAAYMYAPGRAHDYAKQLLTGFAGTLQADGYGAYKKLGPDVTLALCWSHFRRKFYDIAEGGNAPIATQALDRIGQLYGIEVNIRGRPLGERKSARQIHAKPIVDDLRPWLEDALAPIPGGSPLGKAIRYGLTRWEDLNRYLDNGRIEIDTNTSERALRPSVIPVSFCTSFSSI